jgi:phosphoserine aminotransferase
MEVGSLPALSLADRQAPRPGERHNFSAGPGALPESVLAETRAALTEVPEVGLSLLGISHRTEWFRAVVTEAAENIRALLSLPDQYHVLFLQGGGSLQFSMIPMNLLRGRRQPAEYLTTGYWSQKAVAEARREGPVRLVWNGEEEGYRRLPTEEELELDPTATYRHYVSNETVEGLQFHRILGRDETPRICDMSSDFLSRPVEAERFAMIYAHAQKNLGPAGVTVVLMREDMLPASGGDLPAMLDYRVHVEKESIYNTPPVFAIYVSLLVTRWLRRDIGGLAAMGALNRAKAERLYAALDESAGFYRGHAARADRSWMNVVFNLPRRELEEAFLREAEACGLHGLQGHRTLGGLRASLYNAVTLEAVEALCGFMRDFRDRYGDAV